MFEYTSNGQVLDPKGTIWSQRYLYPLAPDCLTPFSRSVLVEITRRAWYRYYDRLEVDQSGELHKVIRSYQGRLYLNLTLLGQVDAGFAAIDPLIFQINDQPVPVYRGEKAGGLLAGFRNSRNRKRIEALLDALDGEIEAITRQVQAWYARVMDMQWTQAEILQIMEEIERLGTDSLMAFYAARHRLELAYNYLLRIAGVNHPYPANLNLVNGAFSDLEGLVEQELIDRMLDLGRLAGEDRPALAWLQTADLDGWQASLPDGRMRRRFLDLLNDYGHRAPSEGEIANPRWAEEPSYLFRTIGIFAEQHPRHPGRIPSAQSVQKLSDAVGGKQRPSLEQTLARARQLLKLQSRAMHAFAYILAGTRTWLLAAGRESAENHLIRSLDDIYFLELEEIKRMMTGEWNISDQATIRSTVQARRSQYSDWAKSPAAELLVGDVAVQPAGTGVSGVTGRTTGPLRRPQMPKPTLCADAIVGAIQLDSGWTPVLPVVGGFVTATGTPLDPFVAMARVWHVPTVLGLGKRYGELVDGAQTVLDGESATVEQ